MLSIRRADERGQFTNDWLNSQFSFSFGEYYDPEHMGFSDLRVINDDRIIPGGGFATHPHRNMEIVSYVLSGELAHKDSMGNGSTIRPGEVQRMSAGTGVTHSEFNPSDANEAHLLQIWLLPNKKGIEPDYEQKLFSDEEKRGQLRLLVSADGRDGSISAHTDALMYGTLLAESESVSHTFKSDRIGYVHVAKGSVEVNGLLLKSGDALNVLDETFVTLTGKNEADVLLFDLPRI